MKRLMCKIGRLRRCNAGGPMVEFAMILPLLLLFFAVIVEGGRVTWIYQATAAGVRDASRMIARIAPPDACASGGSGVGTYITMAEDIVVNRLGGSSILPLGSTLVSFNVSCHQRSGTYRIDPTSVVEVSAQIRIEYLFGGIFGYFDSSLDTLDTVIADQSRIFGV